MSNIKHVQSAHSGANAEFGASFPSMAKRLPATVYIADRYADQIDDENAYMTKERTRLRLKLGFNLVPLLWFNVVTTATAHIW